MIPRSLHGALVALALMLTATGATAETKLKFGHYNAESHPVHKAALQFKQNVEKRTNGEIRIEIYPNNVLGSPPEILEQARNGVIDIAIPTSGQLDKYDKAFAALMIPFAFADLDHARRAMDGPMLGWLTPVAEKSGFAVIGVWEYGFSHLTNGKRPVNKPDDVKGLKIRTPPELQLSAAMAALGGNVQKIGIVTHEAITPAEATWLAERIGKDGKLTPNERALLAFLKAESPSIDPALQRLVDKATAAA